MLPKVCTDLFNVEPFKVILASAPSTSTSETEKRLKLLFFRALPHHPLMAV
jgi:hypothetical protein